MISESAGNTAKVLLYKIAKNLFKKPDDLLALGAVSCLDIDWIEENILLPRYHHYLQSYENSLPEIDNLEAKIVQQLDQTGIYITSLEKLKIPGTEYFLENTRKMSAELAEIAAINSSKNQSIFYANSEQFLRYPEVFNWGLEKIFLRIAHRYLRVPVAYNGCAFSFSLADGKKLAESTRVWHKDRHDRHIFKIGIYLNDVDKEGGPFEYLTPEVSASLPNSGLSIYKYVEQNPDAVTQVTGKAGTVFFADTALLKHRGKPPTKSNRSAIYYGYFTRRPRHPFWCGKPTFSPEGFARLTGHFTRDVQACAQWREELPLVLKWLANHGAS